MNTASRARSVVFALAGIVVGVWTPASSGPAPRPDAVQARQGPVTHLTYDIQAGGTTIGTMRVKRWEELLDGLTLSHADTKTTVRTKSLLFSYALEADEHSVTTPDGLVEYAGHFEENGTLSHVDATIRDATLECTVVEGEDTQRLAILRSDYDVTSVETALCPPLPVGGRKRMRVLELCSLQIEDAACTRLPDEERRVGTCTLKCRAVAWETRTASGTRWVAHDELGSFLVAETGRDEDGPYTITLSSRRREELRPTP